MQAPVRPNRARASGGRTLILLGVLLALAAGAIVIYIVSTAGGGLGAGGQVTVVVANEDLTAGDVLSTSQSGTVNGITYIPISAAFVTKQVNSDFAPKNAYVYQNATQLNALLNNETISSNFYAGEILRQSDPRLAAQGAGAPNSLTLLNPGQLKNGDVLKAIALSAKPAVVAGDYVNIIATFCNIPGKTGHCESQETLKNVYVYAVSGNSVFVVLSNQDAVNLVYLTTTASNYELVIRKPSDTTVPTTTPADNQVISQAFGY